MAHFMLTTRRMAPLALCLVLAAAGAECPNNNNNNNNNNSNQNNNNNSNTSAQLFVVNDDSGITSYANPNAINGNVEFTTRLPAGSDTEIFNPRAIAVTTELQLLVGRENGGITIHDDALTVTGTVAADRIIAGSDSLLTDVISFAYNASDDILYVGNISSDDGILVFEQISAHTFSGESDIAPDRKFNPPDRAPSDTAGMVINSMALDPQERLFVADTSGTNLNSSRILVFEDDGAFDGEMNPARTITNAAWGVIETIKLDSDGRLYVVDGSANIYVYNTPNSESGETPADKTMTIPGDLVALDGIAISADGRGFFSDSSNSAVYRYDNLGSLPDDLLEEPDATIDGTDTALSSPRQMFLVEP